MKYGRYGWSHVLMSWGLGVVFLWIGLDMWRHPDVWIGFIPDRLPGGLSRAAGLQLAALFDTAVGLGLILRLWPKLVAFLAALHLAGILVKNGIDALLIRDVGLLGAALALLMWPAHYRRKTWWRFWQRGASSREE